jgi:hypothetical protein
MKMKRRSNRQRKAKMAFLCGSANQNLSVFAVLSGALLVGYRAGCFACRLAACLAFAARGVFTRFDAGFLDGLHMFHGHFLRIVLTQ